MSYLYLDDDWGGGLGFACWGTQVNLFQAPLMVGSQRYVAYKDPFFSVFFLDLQLHALPWKISLSFYGVLGLGSSSESYTISGAQSLFTDWNGAKDISEFKTAAASAFKFFFGSSFPFKQNCGGFQVR